MSNENEGCAAVQLSFEERIEETGIPSRLNVSQEFGFWMAGFTDGEGSLILRKDRRKDTYQRATCQRALGFKIELRDDDTSALILIKGRLGCGNVTYHQQRKPKVKAKPLVTFKVCGIKDLTEIIVPLFEAFPLHTKKLREFEIWKKIVLMKYRYTAGGRIRFEKWPRHYETYCDEFDKAAKEIKNIRTYGGRDEGQLSCQTPAVSGEDDHFAPRAGALKGSVSAGN
jgi:hypothetical protein